jgi:hypothetical protein
MMTQARMMLAGLLVMVVSGSAGCEGGSPPASPAVPDVASPAPSPPGSSVQPEALCVAGKWQVTGVRSAGGFGTAAGRVDGGAGATMTVGADGVTSVDFTESEPVTFSAEAAGAQLQGRIEYTGTVTAAVEFRPAAGDGPGTWRPVSTPDDNELRATVRLTEPVSLTLLDDARIGDMVRRELPRAGDALDIRPILRGGTYRCAGDDLQVRTEQNGPTVTWLFKRAR